jgi:branched-chain amino acid transport system permease protein
VGRRLAAGVRGAGHEPPGPLTLPSLALLGQSILSGIFIGGLYGLLGLGLSLTWGMLRQINLAHFALAFLGAYLTYHLATVGGMHPVLTVLVIVPLFFAIGVGLHLVFTRFGLTEFTSLLVTFGVTVILESLIQWQWTADFRKLETGWSTASARVGALFVPLVELAALLTAAALATATWVALRFTWLGKAMRAMAEDPPIAAAFGVDHRRLGLLLSGVSAAYAGVAGVFIALTYTLAPAQIYAWVGVVFAAVILGGLGNPLGPLVAGVVIGVSEAVTMALTAPAWAPLVSFTLLILVLLLRPDRI